MKLFQFAVVLHPTDTERESGKGSTLIVDVQTVVAKDDKGAMVLAARAIPEAHLKDLERVEVFLRAF